MTLEQRLNKKGATGVFGGRTVGREKGCKKDMRQSLQGVLEGQGVLQTMGTGRASGIGDCSVRWM